MLLFFIMSKLHVGMTFIYFTLCCKSGIIIIEDIFVTTKETNIMYEIIYNGEVIDTAKDTYEACELVKEYRIAFKSGNIWYRRGDK